MSMGCAGLCCQDMIVGQAYTFYFTYGGLLQVAVDPTDIQNAVARDSNFSAPSAVVNKGGLLAKASVSVSFTYQGQGSLVGQAGQEMANIVNNFWTTGVGTSLIFAGSTTGVAAPDCPSDPNGIDWTTILLWGGVALGVLIFVLPEVFSFEALKSLGRGR